MSSQTENKSMMEFIPQGLRAQGGNVDALASILPIFLARDESVGLDEAISFISGFMNHHYEVMQMDNIMDQKQHPKGSKLDTGWRYFTEEVKEVTTIKKYQDPKTKKKWLGTKGLIVFTSKNDDGKNNTIETDWIEHAWETPDRDNNAWDRALSLTMMAVAEESIELGAKVSVCKQVWSLGQKKAKKIIDCQVQKKTSNGGRIGGKSTGSNGNAESRAEDMLDKAIDEAKASDVFTDEVFDWALDLAIEFGAESKVTDDLYGQIKARIEEDYDMDIEGDSESNSVIDVIVDLTLLAEDEGGEDE